jgi:hypothetical protein
MEQYIHYIYKTTNIVNKKFYVGKHSQKTSKKDTYMGSGNVIQMAIKKYGKENFTKEIISYHASSEDAFIEECNVVTIDLVNDDMCYNIHVGGVGGYAPGLFRTDAHSKAISESKKGKSFTKDHKQALSKCQHEYLKHNKHNGNHKIYVMDKEHNIIHQYESIKATIVAENVSHHLIATSIKNKHYLNDLIFTKNKNENSVYTTKIIKRPDYKAISEKVAKAQSKKVYATNKITGDVRVFESLSKCTKELSFRNISAIIRGIRGQTHPIYTFSY